MFEVQKTSFFALSDIIAKKELQTKADSDRNQCMMGFCSKLFEQAQEQFSKSGKCRETFNESHKVSFLEWLHLFLFALIFLILRDTIQNS